MTGLVAPGVDAEWSEAEPFGCAESVDSVRELSVTRVLGWAVMKGWHFGKYYPSDFNRPFVRFMHSRLVEHDVQTSDDLSVLGVPKSVSDLAVGTIAKENTFPGSWFEFSAVVFRYEGIRLASKNPQFVVIRHTTGP